MGLFIFDLDGTLIDSKKDLAESVNAMRRHLDMEPLADEVVYSYVGNGAPVLVKRAMREGATQAELDYALEYFLSYYRDHMLDHTRLYGGVREALDRLREEGQSLAVLTNKPVRFSEAIVRGLGLDDYFFRVYGGNSFEQKKPHPVGIERLMEESEEERERSWMVGDSAVDIRTARNAGVKAVGVTYGFQPETLADEPPDMLVDDLREMVERVFGEAAAG